MHNGPFVIGCTRFNQRTSSENKQWRSTNPGKCIYGGSKPLRQSIGPGIRIAVVEMNNDTNTVEGIGLINNNIPSLHEHVVYSTHDYNRFLYVGCWRIDRKSLLSHTGWNPRTDRTWSNKTPLQHLESFLFKGKKHMKRGSGITTICVPEALETAIIGLFSEPPVPSKIPSPLPTVDACMAHLETLSQRVATLEHAVGQKSMPVGSKNTPANEKSISPVPRPTTPSKLLNIIPDEADLDLVAASESMPVAAARLVMKHSGRTITCGKGFVFTSGQLMEDSHIKSLLSRLTKDLQKLMSKRMSETQDALAAAHACTVQQQLFQNLYGSSQWRSSHCKTFRQCMSRMSDLQ